MASIPASSAVANFEKLLGQYRALDNEQDEGKRKAAEAALAPQIAAQLKPLLQSFGSPEALEKHLSEVGKSTFETLKKRDEFRTKYLDAETAASLALKVKDASGQAASAGAMNAALFKVQGAEAQGDAGRLKLNKRQRIARESEAQAIHQKLVGAESEASRKELESALEQALGKLPKGNAVRKDLEAKLASYQKAKDAVVFEAGGLEGTQMQEALATLQGELSNLSAPQQSALRAWFADPQGKADSAELAALSPAQKKKLEDARAAFHAGLGSLPEAQQQIFTKMLRGQLPTEAELAAADPLASEGASQAAAAGASGAASVGPQALSLATVNKLPQDLRGPATEYLMAKDRSMRIRESNFEQLSALLKSGLPIEMIIFMFMAIFSQNQEEKAKLKMQELSFAESVTLAEQRQQAERARRAQLGIHTPPDDPVNTDIRQLVSVKGTQAVYQELQYEMTQLSQMMQALAGVLRQLQDMAMAVIRNIR